MSIKNLLLLMVIVTGSISCTSGKIAIGDITGLSDEVTPPEENVLAKLMTGTYTSSEQAMADSSYYDITLHMYPIWRDKADNYLYVEQSMTTMQDKPYRQRVYKVEKLSEVEYRSWVYTLPNETLFIGKWKDPGFFDAYSPEDLIEREGCAVQLNRIGPQHYKGSTDEKSCESSLRGASYATSHVEVRPRLLTSWDQGFNEKGEQVWGAVDGPYIFKMKVEDPYSKLRK